MASDASIAGYRGERIEIARVLEEISAVALSRGWHRDSIPATSLQTDAPVELLAYHRRPQRSKHCVYISTGIHGDEPAGPLAVLQLIKDDCWPEGVEVYLCPCLNPTGFVLNRRENSAGVDLNRDYRNSRSPEARSHIEWLKRTPRFDVSLCLHEDWESRGFYLYELNPDTQKSFAEAIIASVAEICPIDRSQTIDSWPARDGIIHPPQNPDERPEWPEALYLITSKTRLSYTLESPSGFPLVTRVAAQVRAVQTVLNLLGANVAAEIDRPR